MSIHSLNLQPVLEGNRDARFWLCGGGQDVIVRAFAISPMCFVLPLEQSGQRVWAIHWLVSLRCSLPSELQGFRRWMLATE